MVVNASFLPGKSGLMVPRTSDGRVLFAIPYQGHTLIGTTDTSVNEVPAEPAPRPLGREIQFILETARCCMARPPRESDVLSTFAGIRPLVLKGTGKNTAALSRDHTIRIEPNGMLTIVGGKWTTYRNMAEDCVNKAAQLAGLPARPSRTKNVPMRRRDKYAPGPRLRLRSAVHGSRYSPCRPLRNGEDRRGCSGAPDALAFPECRSRPDHGSPGRRPHGGRTRLERCAEGAQSRRFPEHGGGLPYQRLSGCVRFGSPRPHGSPGYFSPAAEPQPPQGAGQRSPPAGPVQRNSHRTRPVR